MNNQARQEKKISFRQFVLEMWLSNKDELDSIHQTPYTLEQYFGMYKWWLRGKYRNVT